MFEQIKTDVLAIIAAVKARDIMAVIAAFATLLTHIGVLPAPATKAFASPPKAMMADPLMVQANEAETVEECCDCLEAAVAELDTADGPRGGFIVSIIVSLIGKIIAALFGF